MRRYLVQLRLCGSCSFCAMDQGSRSVCLLSAHKDSDITAYLKIGSRGKKSDNRLLLRHSRARIHISMVSDWGYYLLSGHCTSTKQCQRGAGLGTIVKQSSHQRSSSTRLLHDSTYIILALYVWGR